MNEAHVISDLRVKGHYDHPIYGYESEKKDIKRNSGRLRKMAGRYGYKVTISQMEDDEGRFLRVKVVPSDN